MTTEATEFTHSVYLRPRIQYGTQRLFVGDSTFGYIRQAIQTLMGDRKTLTPEDIRAFQTLEFDVKCDVCAGYVDVSTDNGGIICDNRSIWRHAE